MEKYTIKNLLKRKIKMSDENAAETEAFLRPFLEYDSEKRISAKDALRLPWLWN